MGNFELEAAVLLYHRSSKKSPKGTTNDNYLIFKARKRIVKKFARDPKIEVFNAALFSFSQVLEFLMTRLHRLHVVKCLNVLNVFTS